MPTFSYQAVDPAGAPARGLMQAINTADLELRLQRMGLDLVAFDPVTRQHDLLRRQAVSVQDLLLFCLQLELLTRAGIPLLEGLADVRDSTAHPRLRAVITSLISEVEGGKQLSAALAAHPETFKQVFVSLVKAGEQSGQLPQVLNNLATMLKWQDQLGVQARQLLAYPALVLAAVAGACAFLLLYLVPQMVPFLRNLGQTLPPATRLLISISDMLVHHWWWMALSCAIIAGAMILAIRHSPRAARLCDRARLNLPMLGEILQKIIMARIARYFALMYVSGIPVLDALHTCQDIADNRVIAEALEQTHQQISSGGSLSDSLQNTGLFPPLMVHMIRVGENTGALDEALLNISGFYERDVKESLDRMLSLLEPALTLLLGVLLALIMFAVLAPVYDTLGKLKL